MRLVKEVWASNIIILISRGEDFSLYSKGIGKGSWSLISTKVTYRLEAAVTPTVLRSPPHSLSALKHRSHGSLQKDPSREAHGKLTWLGNQVNSRRFFSWGGGRGGELPSSPEEEFD